MLAAVLSSLAAAPAAGGGQDGAGALELTLDRAVRIALRNNRSLQSARLGRATGRFSLEVAEDRYRPRASIEATASDGDRGSRTAELSVEPMIRIPAGGVLGMRWSEPLAGGNGEAGTWTLSYSQPLLRGFGPGIDGAPLHTARIRERMTELSFRDTVATTVESVIHAYRRVIREHRALAISRDSLARSRKQIEINRALIRAGRLAEREIIQTEAEFAMRELALAESEDSLNSANADLVSILDVDEATRILPVDTMLSVEASRPDPEQSIATAFGSRTDLLRAQLAREVAAIDLRLAENDRLWDLRLTAHVSRRGVERLDRGVSLGLSVPLGDRSDELALVRARNGLRDAEIALVELRQSIRVEVRQAVRGVEVGFRRIELARKARELVEQQLEVERSKLAQGLSSAYQLTAVEDDLVSAQNGELDAIVSYLDAVASLDRTLGTTLRTWGIDVEEVESGTLRPESAGVPEGADGRERRPGVRLKTSSTPGGQSTVAAVAHQDRQERRQPPERALRAANRILAGTRTKDGAGFRAGSRAQARRALLLSLDEFESVATAAWRAAAR